MEQPLTFEMFREVQAKLEALGAPLSEYNFPNLFFFREKHEYRLLGDVIRGKSYQGETFCLPLKRDFKAKEGPYFPIPDEWLKNFEGMKRYERAEDRDYLFRRETLEGLPGRHRSGQRNQIAQFERDHPFAKVHPLEEEQFPLVLGLLDEWELLVPEGDAKNAREALKYMDAFDLEGIMLEDGNEAAGFLIFSVQNSETLLLHFAKSLPRFKGAFPYLIRSLARATSYPWINFEQDLGIEGIRKEKESLVPDLLKKKWWVSVQRG